jgi:hypothetical protein
VGNRLKNSNLKHDIKGRPFGAFSQKTFECLLTNKQALEAGKDDPSKPVDLNPMRHHLKFRFVFTTSLVDRDIP